MRPSSPAALSLLAVLFLSACNVASSGRVNTAPAPESTAPLISLVAASGAAAIVPPPRRGVAREFFVQELVTALQRAHPRSMIENHADEVLEIRANGGGTFVVPVGPYIHTYELHPELFRQVVSGAVGRTATMMDHALTWEQAESLLLPRLVLPERFRAWEAQGSMPLGAPINPQMMVGVDVYVSDRPYPVHYGLSRSWHASAETVLQRALANLEARTPPLELGSDGLWQFPVQDRDAAVRILLEDRFIELAEQMGRPPVIAIPSRDKLYAFPAGDERYMAQMRERTATEYYSAQEPLLLDWFTLSGDRITLYRRFVWNGE